MHNHLEESDSRNADVFEVMWIFLPWSFIIDDFLLSIVVAIKGVSLRINELDGIFKLYLQ